MFLITDSKLQVPHRGLYRLFMEEVGHNSWDTSLLCSPLHLLRIKAIFLFPTNSVLYFLIQLHWRESQDFGQQQYLIMEKAMATHSSTLAWKIPWMKEPGRLQSMGSLRVGHDWATSLSLFTCMHCRRKWQPTPVFLPGESQGWGSLVGCHLWGRTESDTTDAT